jgi:phosphoribosylanthranilate isomerase
MDRMWIKICGVRTSEAARAAAAAGADAIGLNFFAGSPRAVDAAEAMGIVRAVPEAVTPVGVFVNHPVRTVVETVRECGLRAVQLHGDEPPGVLAELRQALDGVHLIRAWRLGVEGIEPLAAWLARTRDHSAVPDAVLIDARVEGRYGGTGQAAPWGLLAGMWPEEWPRLILAGGLTPENVCDAIRTTHPWGVDVAGGVESAPGVKDPALVRRFIEAARSEV